MRNTDKAAAKAAILAAVQAAIELAHTDETGSAWVLLIDPTGWEGAPRLAVASGAREPSRQLGPGIEPPALMWLATLRRGTPRAEAVAVVEREMRRGGGGIYVPVADVRVDNPVMRFA